MEIKEMNMEQVETRMAEIRSLIDSEDADIDALTAETDALIEQRGLLISKAEEKRALLDKVANSNIEPIAKVEERTEMSEVKETRKAEMVEALAEYIKGNATPEQRAMLLTTNASGSVKVSDIVDDYIWATTLYSMKHPLLVLLSTQKVLMLRTKKL